MHFLQSRDCILIILCSHSLTVGPNVIVASLLKELYFAEGINIWERKLVGQVPTINKDSVIN